MRDSGEQWKRERRDERGGEERGGGERERGVINRRERDK